MKKFCLNCGEELFLALGGKKFCCSLCREKYERKKLFPGDKVNTIENSFPLFKAVAAASRTLQEFDEYRKIYFGGDGDDKRRTERRPRAE